MMWLLKSPSKWQTTDIKPFLGEVVDTNKGFYVWRIQLDGLTMSSGRAEYPVQAMEKVREILNTIDLEVEGEVLC